MRQVPDGAPQTVLNETFYYINSAKMDDDKLVVVVL